KRPTRGFHTYKGGLLNVMPKTPEESQKAKANNENSPLLRLPRELRDRIWSEALGGQTFNVKGVGHRSPASFDGGSNAISLLRTCRQIYSETALIPYKTSVFHGGYYLRKLCHALRKIKPALRQHINTISISV
ncbi:hypothetical protein DM02DRAFT_477271, partial [Periconia macrospinosa]